MTAEQREKKREKDRRLRFKKSLAMMTDHDLYAEYRRKKREREPSVGATSTASAAIMKSRACGFLIGRQKAKIASTIPASFYGTMRRRRKRHGLLSF